MFNPHAVLQVIDIDSQHKCLVLDDALIDPERWVQQAILQQENFSSLSDSNFPGIELKISNEVCTALMNFIRIPVKQYLNTRRILGGKGTLSIVTKRADQLKPYQWICHSDSVNIATGQNVISTALYLFKNPDLGGTNFFKPRKSKFATDLFLQAANMMSAEDFERKYAIKPAYLTESNDLFELLATVPAKWNRLIVYDGMQLHNENIQHPELMTDDPENGRLCMNGLITGRLGIC